MDLTDASSLNLPFGALGAVIVTALAIPLLRPVAKRVGLLDHPEHRKSHEHPTPLTGGLALAIGVLVGLGLAFGTDWAPFWSLLAGAGVLMLVGLLDDYLEISATIRLLVQILVATVMVYGGGLELKILGPLLGPAIGPIGLSVFSGVFTMACVVFMINAVNMMDGLDGLAGGSAFMVFSLMFLLAALDGAPAYLVGLPLLLASATLGFLVHNLRGPRRTRAEAFLGDTGSTVLGFAMAWLAVALATRPGTEVYPISIAWLLIIPAVDTLGVFVRRIRLGRSPFAPDRAHLHHLLQRCGFRVSTSVFLIHLAVLVAGLFGVVGWYQGWPPVVLFLPAAALILGYQLVLVNAPRLLRWQRRLRRGSSPNSVAARAERKRELRLQRSQGHLSVRDRKGRP